MRRSLIMATLLSSAAFFPSLSITDGAADTGGTASGPPYAADDNSPEAVAWRASQAGEAVAGAPPTDPATGLRLDGPTEAEYRAAGYTGAYPPKGFAARSTPYVAGETVTDAEKGVILGGGAAKAAAMASGDVKAAALGDSHTQSQPATVTTAGTDESIFAQAGDVIEGLVNKTLNISTPQLVTLVGMLAGAFLPGASLLGMSISQITGIASGVAQAIPEAISAFDEMKAVASSGLPPTADQVARWNAAADQAHADFNAAADAVINGQGN